MPRGDPRDPMVTEAVGRRETDATLFVHPSPATELSMLAVLVGTGVLVTRSVDYQQFAPTGGRVPRRDLLVAVSTPVVVISIVAAVVVAFADRPLLIAAAGYVLVVNVTVSVLDVATAIALARQPAVVVVDFDGSDADVAALDPGRTDDLEHDRR